MWFRNNKVAVAAAWEELFENQLIDLTCLVLVVTKRVIGKSLEIENK
jgi:hypothetical protein